MLSNDGSGIVEQSEQFNRGTRVAIFGGGQLGITEDGLQQQLVLVENKRIIQLAPDFTLDEGAALPINYVTAHQAMTRVGRVQPGQVVLISGALWRARPRPDPDRCGHGRAGHRDRFQCGESRASAPLRRIDGD